MTRKQIAAVALFVAFAFICITVVYPLIFNPDAQRSAVSTEPMPPEPEPAQP